MLKARLLRRTAPGGETVLCGFAVEGHADFADHGKDIVCAGVSAVAQAALLGLQDILGDSVRSQMKKGFLRVSVEASRASEAGPGALLRALELGLSAIHRSYPGSMEIVEDGDDDLKTKEGATCC